MYQMLYSPYSVSLYHVPSKMFLYNDGTWQEYE